MKIKRSRYELIAEFRSQMHLLRKAASEFDAGDEEEVRHLAAILRVLLHNAKESRSLLQQLGVQHQLQFLDIFEADVLELRAPLGEGPLAFGFRLPVLSWVS